MKNKILTGVLLVIMLVTTSGWIMSINENNMLTEVVQEQKDDINKKSTEIANLKEVIVEKDTDLESNKVVIKEKNTQIDKLKQSNIKIEEENSGLKAHKEQLQSELTIERSKHKNTKKALEIEKAKKKVVKTSQKSVKKDTSKNHANVSNKSKSVLKEKSRVKTASVSKSQGRTISVSATSYIAMCDTGCSGITASGVDVRNTITHQGMRIIASDLSVLPMYSIVEIDGFSGQFIVLDSGGAIKGNKIDILVNSVEEAIRFGRQQINIRVIRLGA